MKERPILFSAPMVRAILDGTKTQTRRLVKMKSHHQIEQRDDGSNWPWMYDGERDADWWMPCPHGQPGDQLWVREAWRTSLAYELTKPSEIPAGEPLGYEADGEGNLFLGNAGKLRPSMFMPRWASRITLEITSVRVERLQEISQEDAKSEGAWGPDESIVTRVADYFGVDEFGVNPKLAFQMLWESINGPESWAANPWVWVVEFKRKEQA